MKRNEVIITTIKVTVSIVLLIVILYFGNPLLVIEQLISTGLPSLIPLIILYYFAFLLSGIRLKILVSSMEKESKFTTKNAITTHFASTFLADYTPGGAGYAYSSRAISSKTSLSVKSGLVIVVLCFFIDITARFLLSMLSFIIEYLSTVDNQLGSILVLCFIASVIFISYVFALKRTGSKSLVISINKPAKTTWLNFLPALVYRYMSRLEKNVNNGENDYQIALPLKDLHVATIVSIIGWFITGVRFWLTLLILGEPASFLIMIGILPLVGLISFLPISLGNLGILDISYFGILVFFGISPGVAATFVLIDRCLTLLLDFPGYFFLIGNEMS